MSLNTEADLGAGVIDLTIAIPDSLSPGRLMTAMGRVAFRLSQARKRAAASSLAVFLRVYLPHHAALGFSRMHTELFQKLEHAVHARGVRIALAAPRGHAKSTMVSLGFILWCIVFGHEKYILLISDTAGQAETLLSAVKSEIENNACLRADFPDACAVPPMHARPQRWRKGEIITGNGVKVTTLGVDSKVRGRKFNQYRPGLIVVDDCENDESVRNPEQRERLAGWFHRAVLKSGTSTTNTIVMGTIFHYASLLAGLVDPSKSPGWEAGVYKSVERFADRIDLWDTWQNIYCHRQEYEGASGPAAALSFYTANREAMLEGVKVLWPDREDYLELMTLRLREGAASFDAEKQNQPGNSGDGCFIESDFTYWDTQFPTEEALLASFPPGVKFFGAVDPSLGKAGSNRDDCAIITLARHPVTKVMYVLDADIRKRRPDEIIEAVINYQQQRGYHRVAVETNQFQEFLADELRKRSRLRSCPIRVLDINHSTDKLGRMQKLQPLISSGRVRLCRRHVLLLEQLRQFPYAAHDDGPDALEMAVENAQRFFEREASASRLVIG